MKKKTSLLAKAFACTLAAIMAWGGLLACSHGGGSVDVSEVSINYSAAGVNVGDSITLTAVVEPKDADYDESSIKWTSSNPNVLSISGNGLAVTANAHKKGSAYVYVTVGGVKSGAQTFHVYAAGENIPEDEKTPGGTTPPQSSYTVTFNTNGGSTIPSQSVKHGELAKRPENPTKTGSEFLAWYDGGIAFSFLTPITTDITLTARWKDPNKTYCTVTFKVDGEVVDTQAVEKGECVSEPTAPTKDGYDFTGWYTGDETEFDFDTPITGDITLEAGWNEKSSTPGGDNNNDNNDNTVTPGGNDVHGVQDTLNNATISQGGIQIHEASGWLNSAYVIFKQNLGATKYTVKVDGVPIDDKLIRYYTTYTFNTYDETTGKWREEKLYDVVRADALGLKKGNHTITVSADNTSSESSATFNVIDQDRSGFAFAPSAKTTPGAYKADGTLKDKAIVLYVTAETAKTVSYEAKKGVNATKDGTYKGIQNVLSETSLKNLTVPLDIRIIGTIRKDDVDSLGSSAEGLQIKTTSENGVTVEGVGHDAAVYGFGFLIRNAKYTELSNLGVYNFMDDGISVDTDNEYLWIHNNDISYGEVGSDSDQAKGDGSLDFKKSKYSTLSYNHFWDSGKCNLLDASAASSGGSNYLSYHHNWYDHSDSRHPRIRNASAVHVYNNYYDGNAKYGIGVTSGSSCFAEGNYFRDAKNPMMSSMQGTDARADKGTFSSEKGGVIKAWNNKFAENGLHNTFNYISNKKDWTNNRELDEYKEHTTEIGDPYTGGGYLIYSWTYGEDFPRFISCVASDKSGKYQVGKARTGFTLSVPANTTKVIVTAMCGSSGKTGTANMLSVNGKAVSMNMADSFRDYSVDVSVSKDTTIEIANVHKENTMNVTGIKVIAATTWKTTYSTGADLTDIDAYEVDKRKDQVPAVVKTKSGGHMYSNFDVQLGDTGMGISIAPTDPDQAKKDVVKYAGRHNSDFAWTFDNAVEDKNDKVIAELKSAIVNYRSGLTKTQ